MRSWLRGAVSTTRRTFATATATMLLAPYVVLALSPWIDFVPGETLSQAAGTLLRVYFAPLANAGRILWLAVDAIGIAEGAAAAIPSTLATVIGTTLVVLNAMFWATPITVAIVLIRRWRERRAASREA